MNTVHVHRRPRPFPCSTCPRSSYTKEHLKLHELTHSGNGARFPCYFCKKRFIQRSDLEEHTRIHTTEKPFVCGLEACQYSASTSRSLVKHKQTQHHPVDSTNERVSCYFCQKTYASMVHLVNHIRTHTLEEPFNFGLCFKRFRTLESLKHHIYSHTGEKPFRCRECGKCFPLAKHLRHHIRAVHRGEKNFS